MRTTCEHCIGDAYDTYKEKYPEAKYCMYCGRFVGENCYTQRIPITSTDRGMPFSDVEEYHPSFGQIYIGRESSRNTHLYGSSIPHSQVVTLEIKHSVKHTSHHNENYHAYSAPIIKIALSEAQFAQLITSFNMGDGVPCTLRSIRGEHIPASEEQNQSKKVHSDLKNQFKKFSVKVEEGTEKVNEILNKKGTINKSERVKISKIHESLIQDIKSNLPFLHQCMMESYDKTISQAKTEIDAFHKQSLMKMGLEQLQKLNLEPEDTPAALESNHHNNDVIDVEISQGE